MKTKNLLIASLAAACMFTQVGQAIITTPSGTPVQIRPTAPVAPGTILPLHNFQLLTVPFPAGISVPANTVGNDNLEKDNLFGFNEIQNIFVPGGGLAPDIGAFIAPGTVVASHMLVFDPVARTNDQGGILGKALDGVGGSGVGDGIGVVISFDAPVIGIFRETASLLASDALANPGVTYNVASPDRGLEGSDTIAMMGSPGAPVGLLPNQIYIDRWAASTPGDTVRILTLQSPGGPPPPVPTPDAGATAMLLGLGLAAMGFASRRLRRKS